MSSMSQFFIDSANPHLTGNELIKTFRERIVLEEIERTRRRGLELAEQRSNLNPPDVRIRLWEKIHELHLPSDSKHPILDVIARDTGLIRADVEKEQSVRLSAALCVRGNASR